MSDSPRQFCLDCRHVCEEELTGVSRPLTRYRCGHHESLELDDNRGGQSIGLAPAVPWWCPLSPTERAKLPWHAGRYGETMEDCEAEPLPKRKPRKRVTAQRELFDDEVT